MSFFSIVLGGAVIGVGYHFWRRRRDRQRTHFIDTYRFPERLRLKLVETYPHLEVPQQERVLQGLRDYFRLCQMAGRRMVAMPSQAVDVVWHEFILYTRQYGEFCRNGVGRFLHHTPSDAMPSAEVASAGIRRAWRLACMREGIRPDQPDRLPLLFALDGELAIADGFHYRLDCGAHPGRYRNGNTYCASHVGCGSGCASGCGGDSTSGDGGGCGGGGGD